VLQTTLRGLWYTVAVRIALQQLARRLAARVPYPLALQALLSLVLLATLPSALEAAGGALSARFALLAVLVGLDLLMCWVVPARLLRPWQQFAYLALQLGLASLAHVVMPSYLLGYVYLVIVLQAVYLFKPLLWLTFAGGVYVMWSGTLMIASASLIEWARENLILAFPVLCILVAAVVYARQQQRSEQVQHVLHDMQRRYDTLLLHLRDAQEHAALEERQRLAQTVASDITAALAQTEQSIASAIMQAQANLSRLEATVAQTRTAAAATIERMRAAVANLRYGGRDDPQPDPPPALELPPDELMTLRSQRALVWSLPVAFVGVALPLALLQRPVTPLGAVLFALCCAALIAGYIFTQRIRNPLLVQVGLAGQAAAVLGMVFASQALPLVLGLLLVIWQIAVRLSAGQVVAFLVGVQALIGLAFTRILPVPSLDATQLLIFCVACFAVVALIGTARRQLERRRQAAAHLARLAHLTGELEQQIAEVRVLAVAVERTRLAREIHDDLGHRLVLLNLQLQLVEDLIEEDPGAALQQLCTTRERLHEAWSSVIGASGAVLAVDGATVVPALVRLVDHCRTLAPMDIELRIIGDLTFVEPPVACALYRAVQEGLTNACKQAQVRQARVLVYCDDVEAQVSVCDDGPATPRAPQCEQGAGHYGLAGLRERAEMLNGSVLAGPLPAGGFELRMTIPIP
jgi:signal transduction histidine kinase